MNKTISIALLLCCSHISRAQTFEEQIWQEFHKSMDQMHKRFDAIEKHMNQNFPNFAQEQEKILQEQAQSPSKELAQKPTPKKIIDITTDNNFVIIKLQLGELDAKEINIDAEKDNLDGKIPVKNGSANFSIHNGRLFQLSINNEQKKEEKNEKDKVSSYSFASTSSSKIESLPEIVADLEKTQVSYKDGIVELKLPKLSAQKHGTKLNVISA